MSLRQHKLAVLRPGGKPEVVNHCWLWATASSLGLSGQLTPLGAV